MSNQKTNPSWFKWKKFYFAHLGLSIALIISLIIYLFIFFIWFQNYNSDPDSKFFITFAWMFSLLMFLILLSCLMFNIVVAVLIIAMSQDHEFIQIVNNKTGGYLAAGILTIFFGIITSTVAYCLTNSLYKKINITQS